MISVIIITKNEESRIRACLESVKWADEIIVFDNGSQDATIKIVKGYTDKIYTIETNDFASLRNEAIKKAQMEWVLYVDADERVLEPLKNELKDIVNNPQFSAFAISRRNIILGKKVSYGPYKKDWVIRLLKKKDFDKWVGKIHEYPKFKGKLGYTKNSLLHLTHRDVDQIILKSLEWSKIDAKLRLEANHPPMTRWRFLRIFISELFYQGVKRHGFFNGTVGMIDSILQVLSLFITYVRLWQLQQPKPLNQVYNEIDEKLLKDNFKFDLH